MVSDFDKARQTANLEILKILNKVVGEDSNTMWIKMLTDLDLIQPTDIMIADIFAKDVLLIIEDQVYQYPQLRFFQIVNNIHGLPAVENDYYYEEPQDTLKRLPC